MAERNEDTEQAAMSSDQDNEENISEPLANLRMNTDDVEEGCGHFTNAIFRWKHAINTEREMLFMDSPSEKEDAIEELRSEVAGATSDVGKHVDLDADKKDILIIHSEDDVWNAANFKEAIEKLCENKLTPGVTVDLQQHIEPGKGILGGINSLHDRYRFILVFVTNTFQADENKMFYRECVLIFGLDKRKDKLDRVVPVWVDVTRITCNIPYLSNLNGITYPGDFFEEHMFKTVKKFREMIK